LRLTDPLNLPAPGRHQTLYVHLTCLQSPVFLVNSRNPHFAATRARLGSESLHASWPTFFRSYGGNLPSSLERVLSSALGFSPRPPESVCGTDDSSLRAVFFLEAWDHLRRAYALANALGDDCPTFLSYGAPLQRPAGMSDTRPATLLRRTSLHWETDSAGILTCLPSPTPFGLGLGSG
jgi:hypothetical protein